MKISERLKINNNEIRIRSFEIGGQPLRVRIPLSAEAEGIHQRVSNPSKESVEEKYKLLTKSLQENKEAIQKESESIVYTDNDVIVAGKSMREMAENQVKTETRIVETFKLLVPPGNESMDSLTYEEIEEDFPLQTQLNMVKKITEIISPTYEETQKN